MAKLSFVRVRMSVAKAEAQGSFAISVIILPTPLLVNQHLVPISIYSTLLESLQKVKPLLANIPYNRFDSRMPTPESALFLAKKPKVPPTFDGVDYDDTPRLKAAQDAIMREQWIQSMMARLVRHELGKCYRREGVNHLEKCAALRGMLFVPVWSRSGEMGGSVV